MAFAPRAGRASWESRREIMAASSGHFICTCTSYWDEALIMTMIRRRAWLAIPIGFVALLLTLRGERETQAKDPPTAFECRWADTPIKIDGKADDPAWKHAQVIDNF